MVARAAAGTAADPGATAGPACDFIERLLAQVADATPELRREARETIEGLRRLDLESQRNAIDAATSRALLQKAMGLHQPEANGKRSTSAKKKDEETYVRCLGEDWTEAVHAIRVLAGVRCWGPAIADAHRNGCEPAHLLKLFEIWTANKHRFTNPQGELFSRVQHACPEMDAYDNWSIGSLPKPKPPTFDELLHREFTEEIRAMNKTGQGDRDDLLRRWIAFHDRHGEAAERSFQSRLHTYCARIDEANVTGEERRRLKDEFWETRGLFAPMPKARERKAIPR